MGSGFMFSKGKTFHKDRKINLRRRANGLNRIGGKTKNEKNDWIISFDADVSNSGGSKCCSDRIRGS